MSFSDIVLGLTLLSIVGGGLYGLYRKYYLDDGRITLDELDDIVEDVKEIVEDVQEKLE